MMFLSNLEFVSSYLHSRRSSATSYDRPTLYAVYGLSSAGIEAGE